MAAHADDLRHWYGEHLGASEIVAASGVSAPTGKLSPGRYMIHFNTPAGAALCWVRQGKFVAGTPVVATAAAPSTPLDLSLARLPAIFIIIAPDQKSDQLAFITDAGTVNAVVTKVSRDKA